MRRTKVATAILTILTMVGLVVLPMAAGAQTSQAQNQATAIMRGYRTGYSDGYQEGVGDVNRNANRDFHSKSEYDKADRDHNPTWGTVEEYRDGYRQGYEAGYNAAFDHKSFDSSIPPNLTRKTEDSTVQYPIDQNKKPGDLNNQTDNQTNNQTSSQPAQTDNTDPGGP